MDLQAIGIASLSTTAVVLGSAPAETALSIARCSTLLRTADMPSTETSSKVSITPETCHAGQSWAFSESQCGDQVRTYLGTSGTDGIGGIKEWESVDFGNPIERIGRQDCTSSDEIDGHVLGTRLHFIKDKLEHDLHPRLGRLDLLCRDTFHEVRVAHTGCATSSDDDIGGCQGGSAERDRFVNLVPDGIGTNSGFAIRILAYA